MNLLVLGVDGLCSDRVQEIGYPKMPYEWKLTIPRELYFEDVPHTLKIWPSMFHGQAIDIDLRKVLDSIYEQDTLDYKLKQFLIKVGVKKYFKRRE